MKRERKIIEYQSKTSRGKKLRNEKKKTQPPKYNKRKEGRWKKMFKREGVISKIFETYG